MLAGVRRRGRRAWRRPLHPWRRYVRAVAERYAADCPVLEVWNEPNHGQYGYGCQNPTNYVKVLKAAFEEIRAAAPRTQVAVGVDETRQALYLPRALGLALAAALILR